MNSILDIACDDAGHTGPDLLDKDQRYFAYASAAITDGKLGTELPDGGRWTLDLSTSGLWSHLNHWGSTRKLLAVRCDASKPLQTNIQNFSGNEDDPGISRAHRF